MVVVEWFLLFFAMIASVAAGAEDVDDAEDDASEIMCVCAEAVSNQASLSMLITIIAGSST